MKKALLSALIGREANVVKALVDYDVKPDRISMAKLCAKIHSGHQAGEYTWSRGYEWRGGARNKRVGPDVSQSASPSVAAPDYDVNALRKHLPDFMLAWHITSCSDGMRKRWTAEELPELINSEGGYPYVEALKTYAP